MPRPLRQDSPDTWLHVTNRGHNRQDVIRDEDDCRSIASLLEEVTGWGAIEIHAFAFMSNHIHLLIYSRSGGLSEAMKHVMGVYARRFNAKYGQEGSVWKDRYFSLRVTRQSHLMELPRYIDNNPVKAGIVRSPDAYGWSSHRALVGIDPPPAFLSTNVVVPKWFGGIAAYKAFVTRGETAATRRIGQAIEGDARFADLETAMSAVAGCPHAISQLMVEIEEFVCDRLGREELDSHQRGRANAARSATITIMHRADAIPTAAILSRFELTNRARVSTIVSRCEAAATSDPALARLLAVSMGQFRRAAA